MYNKSDEQSLVMQSKIEANKQDYDDKRKKLAEYLKATITPTVTSTMDQITMYKPVTEQKDSPKAQYPIIVVPANRRYPLLDCGHSTEIGDKWTLKNEISSPELYELLTKI